MFFTSGLIQSFIRPISKGSFFLQGGVDIFSTDREHTLGLDFRSSLVQGYPQRMALQRRLYGIYLAFYLTFMLFYSCKFAVFCCGIVTSKQDYTF